MNDVYDDWNNEDNELPEIDVCPYCGGRGMLCDDGYEEPVIDKNGAYIDMDISEGETFWCQCEECDAMTQVEDSPEKAIQLWNRRANNRMKDKKLIAVELTGKHIEILKNALDITDEDYLDVSENVADSIVDLIEMVGEM